MKIHKLKDGGNLLAYASITFDHCFVVKNFKLMQGPNGIFLCMPSEKLKEPKNGKAYADTAFSLNKDFKDYMNQTAVDWYNAGGDPGYQSVKVSDLPANLVEVDEGSLPF